MQQWYNNLRTNWAEIIGNKKFLFVFIVNFVLCYLIYMALVQFLLWNRTRPGAVLDDPIQQLFIPLDLSLPTFFLTYTCIIGIIIHLLAHPRVLHYGFRAFTAVFILRTFFIYLVPLAPPPQTILLKDPFLDSLIWGNVAITNDLFFSGHVADICVFVFLSRSNWLRYFLIVCAVAVGVMVVWQHVHYTADVVAAPFFSYTSYRLFAKPYIKEDSVAGFSPVQLSEKLRTIFVSRVR